MVGSAIFKWYNQLHSKVVEKQGIMDWDPQTMSGFSDGFSYLDTNTPTVIKRSFAFINEKHDIDTPDIKNFQDNRGNDGQNMNSKNDLKKMQFDQDLEKFMNSRKVEVPSAAPRFG